MKKRVILFALVLMMLAVAFAACAPKEEATWSIDVSGADSELFTSADYEKLTEVEIEAVLKKKDGSENTEVWNGIKFKDLADAIGAGDYTSITVEASDGYAKDYTPEIVNDDMTILGTAVDGEALGADGGWVKAVAGSQSGNMWIKDLVKIKVNK